jgi:hypothetical protein
VIVGVVDDVHQLTGLRKKGSNFAVVPPAHDAPAIVSESHAVAFQIRDLDPEQFLAIPRIPDPDVVHGTRRE